MRLITWARPHGALDQWHVVEGDLVNDLDEILELIAGILLFITGLLILLTWLEATLEPDRPRWTAPWRRRTRPEARGEESREQD